MKTGSCPQRYFEVLQGGLPRCESMIMPTVGHIPHLTHGEALAKLIGDWLLALRGRMLQPENCPGLPSGHASCPMRGPVAVPARRNAHHEHLPSQRSAGLWSLASRVG